jgi:hypothetical protein
MESLLEVRWTAIRYDHDVRGTSVPASVTLDALCRAVHDGLADGSAARYSPVGLHDRHGDGAIG